MAEDGFDVKVQGLEETLALLTDLPYKLQRRLAAELKEQLTEVLEKAKDLAPYERGDLAGSGRLVGPRIYGGRVYFTLDFGVEPQLAYALIQHEGLSFSHPGGKESKFLEKPLAEWSATGPVEAITAALRDIK